MLSSRRGLLQPRVLLTAMVAFAAVVSGLAAALMVWDDRADTMRAMEARAAAVAHAFDEHANRTIDGAEQVIGRIADRAADRGMNAADTRTTVESLLEAAPYLSNLYLVDSAGRLVVDARGYHPVGTSLAEREWVRQALAEPDAATVIAALAVDDGSRTLSFAVARRISDAAGRPIGMAAAMVDADYFKRFAQQLNAGPSPVLGVYRLDGAIMARQPLQTDDVGRNMASSPLLSTYLPRSPSAGTFRHRSPMDQVERMMAYRAVPARELVVLVGVGEQDALDGWRARAFRTLAVALAVVAGVVALAWLLGRELARERRASAEMAGLNRDLARSNADLEQFAYIASHDLKEPLRNIASYVQLLQRRYEGKLDPDADAFIGYTVEGVRRMQAIIHELLAYSRIGTGQLSLAPVQAGALVSTALAHLKGVIADAQAAVEVRGPLPVVLADPAQLGSLFQNLIGNALKYRRDDVRPEVVVGCADRGGEWAFYVSDNGIGIDRQYHSQIFDLFKRLHPRDRYPGTGIGLAICQRVAERHGGRVWVESEAGRGSTFWFTLPKLRGE